MRFTVTWLKSVEDNVVEIWLASDDRSGVSRAAHEIDIALRDDAHEKGNAVSEGLRSLDVKPLRVLYTVSTDDRRVEVVTVKPATNA